MFYLSNGTNFIKVNNPLINAGTQQITTNGTAVGAGTCQAQPTASISGLTTSIQEEFDVSTAGTAKVWLCNPTAGSITPSAIAINVKAMQ